MRGVDPSLGIMHADQRYRGSLATDLMEPARPASDTMVLNLLESHEVRSGGILETREGVCRVDSRSRASSPDQRPRSARLSRRMLNTSPGPC
jgi:CRISPR/Cas system-associated endonuclease Cas1